MQNYFIEELEKETGISKREIYNIIRRRDFYKQFGIKKMAELPDATRNGSVSKALSKEQFDYLKGVIEDGSALRSSDSPCDDVEDVVYVVDLFPGGTFKKEDKEERRFKIGFTSKKLSKREKDFRVSNPEAEVVRHWRLGSTAEQILHKYVDGNGCSRIGDSEVYDVFDFDTFIKKIEEFAENLK